MEFMRSWILSVTLAAMIIALAEGMMPAGGVKRIAKLTGGLVLMLGMLQPIVRLDYEELFVRANGLPGITVEESALQKVENEDLMKTIIEEELAAYVLDKAKSLGFSCEVSVHCVLGEDGAPLPERVQVRGLLDPQQRQAMERVLMEDLGIPAEHQTYLNEEVT